MPISLTLTEGVLPAGAEKIAVARITDAFLARLNLSGHKVMTPNVTAHVVILPKGTTFAGGKEIDGAWIELRLPAFALVDRQVQVQFFADATQIVHDLSGHRLPKAQIWTNVIHAVDGTWNMNGVAMTNAELIDTLAG